MYYDCFVRPKGNCPCCIIIQQQHSYFYSGFYNPTMTNHRLKI